MSGMRERVLSELVMPAAAALTPLKSWTYHEQMCAAERAPLAAQRSDQLALVRALLSHAYDETALHRDLLDAAGVAPGDVTSVAALARLPITSKSDLRSGFPDRQLARSYRNAWLRFSNTSGTTGKPLVLVQDATDIAWKYASILRSRSLADVPPMSRQTRLTPNECQPCLPSGETSSLVPLSPDASTATRRAAAFLLLERRILNPVFHRRDMLPPFWPGGGPIGPVDHGRYLAQLRSSEPVVLTVYSLYAMLLARFMRRTGQAPPVITGILEFSGGLCTPRMRDYLSETFGARTAQSCGGCEFARYGASCTSDPDRMHLAESYACVETVRADGAPCAPGELGNVVVTNLHGRAMPIVRLEPGDVGRIVEEPCACGRSSRRIEHHGRVQAVFRNAEGRFVTDRECWDALLCLRGLELFQLRQESETRYRLALVRDVGEELDEAGLGHALETLLGRGAVVEREVVPGIVPEASGKLQLVKSATFESFRPSGSRSRPVPVN